MIINIEMTDTFSGEANYCWVKRFNLDLPDNSSDLKIVRAVKRITDFTAVKCRKENYGDMVALYPSGFCVVIFITFE